MNTHDNSFENLQTRLIELQKENSELKSLVEKTNLRVKNNEERLITQSQRFAQLNKYSLDLANQKEETISSFIVNEFKSLFLVKEVWISIYNEENRELVLEATTLSENDNSKIVRRFGNSIIGKKTQITEDVYNSMVSMGIGRPSSMHEISFGQIPSLISSAVEKLFSIGWFQGITLTDRGKLYGGLLIAGYKGQENLNNDEIRTFSEITSNILRRKLVEKKLIESELRFRQLAELLPQLVFEADIQGNLTFINKFGLTLLGKDQEEQKSGLQLNDLLLRADSSKYPEGFHKVFLASDFQSKEFVVSREDGKVFPLYLHTEVFSEDGKPKGIRGIGVDISNIRKAEEMLSYERTLLRTVLDNIPDLIYAKDTQSRFLICNDSLVKRVGQMNQDQVIGRTDLDLIPLETSSKYFEEEQAIFRSGNPIINKEQTVITPSGQTKYSLVTKVPFHDKQGNIIGIVGIGRDITLHKLAENEVKYKNEQLQKSIAEKDKFFSIIAHDLRSPFNSFLGLTQMISEELNSLSQTEIQHIADNLKKSAGNLYTLLENLLEWSKMQRGQMDFNPVRFNLSHKIVNCTETVFGQANIKNIVITTDIPEKLELVADGHMFDTIIRNLVSNAIKFTPTGGKVIISADKKNDQSVEINVIDSGIGIPDEMKSKLFSVSEKTSRKGTNGEPSTGLGLLLCKEFIEKHKGKIRVASEQGKGSTFTITIPGFGI
jgi:PAS domain S-box-containing protein